MSANRWLATGNFYSTYQEEQRIFTTHLDRVVFCLFVVAIFVWPMFFKLSNKYMLVIDNILIATMAVIGLNLVTGFAGLISIGHAAFVGIGAYTIASFARVLGDDHVELPRDLGDRDRRGIDMPTDAVADGVVDRCFSRRLGDVDDVLAPRLDAGVLALQLRLKVLALVLRLADGARELRGRGALCRRNPSHPRGRAGRAPR